MNIPDGADTQDSVFPLSLDELEKYLPGYRMKVAEGTEYVDMCVDTWRVDSRRMYWLLRTRGKKKDFVQLCVSCPNGWLSEYVQRNVMVFRPAMWVK